MPEKEKAKVCGATIDGPKVGRHVVAWRRHCKNKTRHPSGTCHLHRPYGWGER